MGSATASIHLFSSKPSFFLIPNSSPSLLKPSKQPFATTHLHPTAIISSLHLKLTKTTHLRFSSAKTRATLDETGQDTKIPLLVQEEEEEQQQQPSKEVEESVKVLKNAARTRRVAAEEVLSALSVIEKAKLDPLEFLQTLGGFRSPGRTWMLIFTAKNGLKSGSYFPITAVQRFDATAKRIENGVYLGRLGCLTFEGRFSWKKRILAFIFEQIRIRIGPFSPLEIQFGGNRNDEREPSTKNPFFIWFYVDEEIAVGRGKSGGTAFWCRCRRVTRY